MAAKCTLFWTILFEGKRAALYQDMFYSEIVVLLANKKAPLFKPQSTGAAIPMHVGSSLSDMVVWLGLVDMEGLFTCSTELCSRKNSQ